MDKIGRWSLVIAVALAAVPLVALGHTIVFGYDSEVVRRAMQGPYADTPTPDGAWYDDCPVEVTYEIQPTYTPRAIPTCRPVDLDSTPTPYPTSTDYPPQP